MRFQTWNLRNAAVLQGNSSAKTAIKEALWKLVHLPFKVLALEVALFSVSQVSVKTELTLSLFQE